MTLIAWSDESPRSRERPMAFTGQEFWRGAFVAAGVYMLVLPAAVTIVTVLRSGPTTTPPGSLIALLLGGPLLVAVIAGFAGVFGVLGGAPCAWFLARSLRRVRTTAAHLAAFGAYGAVVGGVGARVLAGMPWLVATSSVVCGVSVAVGWLFAARLARRSDLRPPAAGREVRA